MSANVVSIRSKRRIPIAPTAQGDPEQEWKLELARRFDGPQIREAMKQLDECDEVMRQVPTTERRPRPMLIREHIVATDAACSAYTPSIDAAYYLGLAIGARLARTLGFDKNVGGR